MAEITINLNLENFKVLEVKETEECINILGSTNEDSVSCHQCGRMAAHFHGHDNLREVRYLDIVNKIVTIAYQPKRYSCSFCGLKEVTTTATPAFHFVKSQFTYEFEKHILLGLINSTAADVSKKHRLTEKEVQGIVDRHLAGKVDWSKFETLGVIGIDEIAIKKGRKDYITIVTAIINGSTHILSVILGRKKRDIKRFLKSIPASLKRTVVAVCIDMYDGYVNAAKEIFNKSVSIIIDRYHVSKLYRKSLDRFRKSIIDELKRHLPAEEYEKIKHVTNILRSNKEFFTKEEKDKLNEIFSHSFELAEAYRLVQMLTHIFNSEITAKEGLAKFSEWIAEVRDGHSITSRS